MKALLFAGVLLGALPSMALAGATGHASKPSVLCQLTPPDLPYGNGVCGLLGVFRAPQDPYQGGLRTSYRLLYARSFDPEILIRIDLRADGSASLLAKQLMTHTKNIVINQSIALSASDIRGFEGAIRTNKFWTAPSRYRVQVDLGPFNSKMTNSVIATDGAMWFIEGSDAERYHIMADDGGAFESPVREIGLAMLHLAKAKVPDLKIKPIY